MRKKFLLLTCLLYTLSLPSQIQKTVEKVQESVSEDKRIIYDLKDVDTPPLLSSGESIEQGYFCRTLRYPTIAWDNRIGGIVVAEFVIDSIGKTDISDIQIKTSPLKACSDQVKLRIFSLPPLIPAEKNGEKVNVRYEIWVKFDVDDQYPRYATIQIRSSLSDTWFMGNF